MGQDVISCEQQEEALPTSEIQENGSKINIDDIKEVAIVIDGICNKTTKDSEDVKLCSSDSIESQFSDKTKTIGRLAILIFAIIFMIAGRFGVPDNEVLNVQDKLMNALQFANTFINTPGNEIFRDFFQALCSLMVDIVFIITFGYWVLKGTNGRLPATLGLFYVTRALVQMVWFSPFPQGFYWESPGVPSLVVPYGRGSDFFFSGHSGFLVICASEWHKLKFPRVRNFVILSAIYTILILLIYRIHYSIDVFTGVIFAEWCFCKVDAYKHVVDSCWTIGINKISSLLDIKPGQLLFYGIGIFSFKKNDQRTMV